MQGTELRNLRAFQRILGDDKGLGSVVFATTFWDKIDEREGAIKEKQLAELWKEGQNGIGNVVMWRLDGKKQAGIELLENIKRQKIGKTGTGSAGLDVSTIVTRMEEEQHRERRRLEEERRKHQERVREMERQAYREMEARRRQAMREIRARREVEEEMYRRQLAQSTSYN